ncbi:MAG: CAP domain-containing protein [Corynebacterium sp.]|uniref:CAP domain-containing protein n=1 Tax=Corynebacterium sp. TaxID=1720 RepID=UPI0026DBD17D|nr:CAP domain-containing protein [Corynebacterium sp.]MDO5098051.1 CAP domain-containing protein [Corynebacterium sp.]
MRNVSKLKKFTVSALTCFSIAAFSPAAHAQNPFDAALQQVHSLGNQVRFTAFPGQATSIEQLKVDTFNEMNRVRIAHGKRPIARDLGFEPQAQGWAQYMAATGTYAHSIRNDGSGEVIWTTDQWNAQLIIATFMASPSHNRALMSDVPNIGGIGIAQGFGNQIYIVIQNRY